MRVRAGWFLAIVIGLASAFSLGMCYLWLTFHQIPRQAELASAFERAHEVDLIEFSAGKPTRVVHLKDPKAFNDLVQHITYRQAYWQFSEEPDDSVLIQTIDQKGKRQLAFDVRNDGAIHLRKATRWYRMPLTTPALEQHVRTMIQRDGKAVEDDLEDHLKKTASGTK